MMYEDTFITDVDIEGDEWHCELCEEDLPADSFEEHLRDEHGFI